MSKKKKTIKPKKKTIKMTNKKRGKLINDVLNVLNKNKMNYFDRIAILEIAKIHIVRHTYLYKIGD